MPRFKTGRPISSVHTFMHYYNIISRRTLIKQYNPILRKVLHKLIKLSFCSQHNTIHQTIEYIICEYFREFLKQSIFESNLSIEQSTKHLTTLQKSFSNRNLSICEYFENCHLIY